MMDHTHSRPATRVHVSGDPEGGWIAEVHDDSEPVVLQTAEPHPTSASDVLDQLATKYSQVKKKAIEGWDTLKADFMAVWDKKHPPAEEEAAAEPKAAAKS